MTKSIITDDMISIHAPHTGSDATATFVDLASGISIHAPHTGSDLQRHDDFRAGLFQSTLPIRGATSSK